MTNTRNGEIWLTVDAGGKKPGVLARTSRFCQEWETIWARLSIDVGSLNGKLAFEAERLTTNWIGDLVARRPAYLKSHPGSAPDYAASDRYLRRLHDIIGQYPLATVVVKRITAPRGAVDYDGMIRAALHRHATALYEAGDPSISPWPDDPDGSTLRFAAAITAALDACQEIDTADPESYVNVDAELVRRRIAAELELKPERGRTGRA